MAARRVSLVLYHCPAKESTHIDNPTQRTNGIGTIDDLCIGLHILHDGSSHHDGVIS